MSREHRTFIDSLRGALGLAPLYGRDTSPGHGTFNPRTDLHDTALPPEDPPAAGSSLLDHKNAVEPRIQRKSK